MYSDTLTHPFVSADASSSLKRTFRLLTLMSVCYNLDHGILPAAVPQIHNKYHTDAMSEALLQSLAVAGILCGVVLSLIYRLEINKSTILLSLSFTGVCFLGTAVAASMQALTPMYLWRFLTGLFGSYMMTVFPQWVDKVFPSNEHTARNSELMVAGMMGTVFGYALTFITSPDRYWIPSILNVIDQFMSKTILPVSLLPLYSEWRSLLLDHFEHSLDFRAAFCIAAGVTIGLAIVSALVMPARDLSVPDQFDGGGGYVGMGQGESGFRLLRWIANEDCETTWAELKTLLSHQCFVLMLMAVGTLMTVANGLSFWLFAFYKDQYALSEKAALACVAAVLLLGPFIGLKMASKIYHLTSLTDRTTRQDGTSFSSNGYWVLALLALMSTISGLFVIFRSKNALVTTLEYLVALMFGSTVVPIVQGSFTKAAPEAYSHTAAIFYQLVFQGSWLTGPLAPVFMSYLTRSEKETDGVIYLALLNGWTVIFFLFAYGIRRRQENVSLDDELIELRQMLGDSRNGIHHSFVDRGLWTKTTVNTELSTS
eukprot:Blabericola_migrator_1__8438@NODE_439_length_8451_cov_53_782562_g345_i0_p3_GENE_NODE_439_length_8451_cov_53_782562_g345_i0NODE_439_length_8451_cov_53_782562_g345_i0_p3_ORF_typecomplete_len541_score98_18MFS_1/PF07690_16/4_3e20MFS_1/PF07690_16/2_3OATP/PF03137_20/9_1e06ABC2_membrane_5/PF13346_6/0_0047ABC2_membrane_5/PF13346_6/5_4e03ABC2_membrane_5/PF13346_6/1_5e02ABC2_membrane_5/PF13346_6/4_8e03DUF3278/PF11683_8/4_2e02DUF3278/PF11683_8/0_84DUF3278/PF11683_8/2_1e03_NODE_439_length_8451_cov_53_782562